MQSDRFEARVVDPANPIDAAMEKTGRIQRELEVAGAELGLTHAALERSLPGSVKQGEVARALTQNEVIEEKVQVAADELLVVTELLEEEVAERKRLEREAPGPAAG